MTVSPDTTVERNFIPSVSHKEGKVGSAIPSLIDTRTLTTHIHAHTNLSHRHRHGTKEGKESNRDAVEWFHVHRVCCYTYKSTLQETVRAKHMHTCSFVVPFQEVSELQRTVTNARNWQSHLWQYCGVRSARGYMFGILPTVSGFWPHG